MPDSPESGKIILPHRQTINKNRAFYWHQTTSRPTSTGDHNSSVIRSSKYKLHHFLDDDRYELYNLETDPYEKNNIAPDSPELTAGLEQKLDEWKKEIGAK